ncbi:MAG: hypothetical protein ACXWL5_01260, partial [Candidatus Chromulinivorax sp.]
QDVVMNIHSDFQGYHVIKPKNHKKMNANVSNYVAANGQTFNNRLTAFLSKDGWGKPNVLGGQSNQFDANLTLAKATLDQIDQTIDQEKQNVKEYSSVQESEFMHKYFPQFADKAIHLKQASNRIITNLEEERVKTNQKYQQFVLDQKKARADGFDKKPTRFA